MNGEIQVLEWFKNSGYKFKYNYAAINLACENEHIQVLEWFKNSGYKLKYSRGIFETYFIKLLKFYSYHFDIKKLIIFSDDFFVLTVKFKTKTKYLKGYKKN